MNLALNESGKMCPVFWLWSHLWPDFLVLGVKEVEGSAVDAAVVEKALRNVPAIKKTSLWQPPLSGGSVCAYHPDNGFSTLGHLRQLKFAIFENCFQNAT